MYRRLRYSDSRLRESQVDRKAGFSKIEYNFFIRSRAADQDVALCGRIEGRRVVSDRARYQAALAAVTDASATRPADRDIAGLGQL